MLSILASEEPGYRFLKCDLIKTETLHFFILKCYSYTQYAQLAISEADE